MKAGDVVVGALPGAAATKISAVFLQVVSRHAAASEKCA